MIFQLALFGLAAIAAPVTTNAPANIVDDAHTIVSLASEINLQAPPLATLISAATPDQAAIQNAFIQLDAVTTQYFDTANNLAAQVAASCNPSLALSSSVQNQLAHNAHFTAYMNGLRNSLKEAKFNQASALAAMARVSDNAGEITKIPGMTVNRLKYCN
ncbi:hypothetical protein BC830DRAFT_1137334 [Chytriomyces sp. MP71]|nr:hypothetical protein BC830DRAFT_1137334 [Chytriomyces sp. MP71]